MPTELEHAILKTICYFDLFDFPLTPLEIYKYLFSGGQSFALLEIERALPAIKSLEFSQGFYFLKNRDAIVATRKQRYLLAQNKIKKARPYLWLLSRLPFVRQIYIVNNLAILNSQVNSDIDLSIVSQNNHLWTCRFFCALLMKLLNKRPNAKSAKDKICLSFFCTEQSLNFETMAYEDDVHFIYWTSQFLPIYNNRQAIPARNATHSVAGGLNNQFEENRNWLKKYLPNIYGIETNQRWTIQSRSFFKNLWEKLLPRFCETFLKKIQIKAFPSQMIEQAKTHPKDIILSDQVLKFHTKDNRLDIKSQLEAKIKALPGEQG